MCLQSTLIARKTVSVNAHFLPLGRSSCVESRNKRKQANNQQQDGPGPDSDEQCEAGECRSEYG
jgi:hypothetical protein